MKRNSRQYLGEKVAFATYLVTFYDYYILECFLLAMKTSSWERVARII